MIVASTVSASGSIYKVSHLFGDQELEMINELSETDGSYHMWTTKSNDEQIFFPISEATANSSQFGLCFFPKH